MKRLLILLAVLLLAASFSLNASTAEGDTEIPRTPDGRPDLSGTYDIATLTPLQRPAEYGDSLYMTPDQAEEILEANRKRMAEDAKQGGGDREAPPAGGDGSTGASGNVGGAH